MKADLIIPTYRPDDTFCLLLQKLQEQTFVVHRVIILNTEEKLWKEAVEKYPIEQSLCGLPCEYTLYHISKEMFDHGGTRMCGVKHSDADIVIFMTQDAVPADKNLVANLVKGLEERIRLSVMQDSFRMKTAALWNAIQDLLIIRMKAGKREKRI